MNTLDKYFADKCNIPLDDDGYSEGMEDENGFYVWTVTDQRCREVIRGEFKIVTDYCYQTSRFKCKSIKGSCLGNSYYLGDGKTIAEAEINLLKAIYEDDL